MYALAALLVLAPDAESQTEQPTFRSGVQAVEVDVRVFDGDGNFVADLTREEFELVENGVTQRIQTLFLVQGINAAPAGASSATGGAAPGSAPPPPASARQTWVFVFDLNHLTPGGGFDRARQAVERFVRDRFKDGDLAGIVSGSAMVNNRLTSVREELVEAVKSVKPRDERRRVLFEMTRDWPRLLNESEVMQVAREERDAIQRATIRACSDDPTQCPQADTEIRMKARRLAGEIERGTMETLKAINALASGLARVPGPKTIVFLSDGFAVENVETTLRSVVGQAARAGARVYAIDVRGLNRGLGGTVEQLAVTDEAGGFAGFDALEDAPNSLAVDTGGLMIRNENDIGRALDRVAEDTSRYYVLAYQPANTTFDGKFRPIEVRVKRPGVRVRARSGYLALAPAKMLVPRPVAPSPSSFPAGKSIGEDEAAGVPDRPATEPGPSEARPATTGGTVVPPSGTAPAGAVRLRPDAKGRVETLAGGDTAAAGALARNGWEAYQRGDIEAAIGPLTEAAAAPDARPWVLYALGFSQVALGRHAAAVVSWERVRQAAPEFEPVYIDLADAYVQLSNTTRALAVLREAEERWPGEDEVHNAIGVIHVKRGALDEAIEAFKKAVTAAPVEGLGYLNLARAYELRHARGRRWVQSQRRWVAPDEDRRRAAEAYRQCIKAGGPYGAQAAEALSRLEWSKPQG